MIECEHQSHSYKNKDIQTYTQTRVEGHHECGGFNPNFVICCKEDRVRQVMAIRSIFPLQETNEATINYIS